MHSQAIKALLLQVDELLGDASTAQATLEVLQTVAEQTPDVVLEHFPAIGTVVKTNPALVAICAQILSTAGKVNKVCSRIINLESISANIYLLIYCNFLCILRNNRCARSLFLVVVVVVKCMFNCKTIHKQTKTKCFSTILAGNVSSRLSNLG